MEDMTRRALVLGGAGAMAGSAAVLAGGPGGATGAGGQYLWGFGREPFPVPSDTWTRVPWPLVVLNTTTVTLDEDDATWRFPAATASGIWFLLANVAWDNARSPTGEPIKPPTHRKLARLPQQRVGSPQVEQLAITGAQSELLYHADLAARRDQELLADGSRGYQEQQVTIQAGVRPGDPDQLFWVEVYQDSGMTLSCPVDGTAVAGTATQPPMQGWQAPSFMAVKLCDY